MRRQSVLISGAGIAGPTLAFWLHKAGFTPTLIERAPAPRTGGYVIDFWGLGYDIAERMGLAAELVRVGYHVRELRIVDDGGSRKAGFGVDVFRELTGGRYVSLRRSDLSRLLLEKAAACAEMVFDDEIIAIDDDLNVRFKHGRERRFDLVIGADGLHSSVRRLVFGPDECFEKPLGYLVAAFETRGYRPRDEDVYVAYGAPGRQLSRFALRGDRTLFLFVAVIDPATLIPMPDVVAQKSMLRTMFGDGQWETATILDALDQTEELYLDRVSQIVMDRWSCGRVVLIGDAAFSVSLMGGQGSALAMTAAYVLAGELARSQGRHEDAFSAYETLLRRWLASKQRAAARFAVAFAPRSRWGLFLRNQVTKAFAIPGLSRLVIGRGVADTLALPAYDWRVTADAAQSFGSGNGALIGR